MTGIRPAGTSRDSTSTSTPCSRSLRCAWASRSGAARARSRSSQREPLREWTPRRPSQYSPTSPRNAAHDATAKTISSENGEVWWKATTAAELTSAPVGTTGTKRPQHHQQEQRRIAHRLLRRLRRHAPHQLTEHASSRDHRPYRLAVPEPVHRHLRCHQRRLPLELLARGVEFMRPYGVHARSASTCRSAPGPRCTAPAGPPPAAARRALRWPCPRNGPQPPTGSSATSHGPTSSAISSNSPVSPAKYVRAAPSHDIAERRHPVRPVGQPPPVVRRAHRPDGHRAGRALLAGPPAR